MVGYMVVVQSGGVIPGVDGLLDEMRSGDKTSGRFVHSTNENAWIVITDEVEHITKPKYDDTSSA